ncbi:MAG: YdcF family protein [Clostridia bacterium]|nr:YdcF family protein [Clostridia bacterium]
MKFSVIPASITGFAAAFALAYMPFVVSASKKKYEDDCDWLLILGSNVIGADTPSAQLTERMKSALSYLKSHPDTKAVPCGGCFRKGQKKSEAQIVADYLTENGISPDRLFLEDKSTTTFENFRFAFGIIEKQTGKPVEENSVAYLTSPYHIFRSGIIAKKYGCRFPGRVTAGVSTNEPGRFIREYFVGYDLIIRYFFGK